MKIAIMQPYFFPYIGYFQLISSVDKFLLYENVKFRKKSWITRNYILPKNGEVLPINIPLEKISSYKTIKEMKIASGTNWNKYLAKKIFFAYKNAAYFDETFPVLDALFSREYAELHYFNSVCIIDICRHLGILTNIISENSNYLELEEELDKEYHNESNETADNLSEKKTARIIRICKKENSDFYNNPINGVALYKKSDLAKEGIKLGFIKTNPLTYRQFNDMFIPNLSIIDVLMHNGSNGTKKLLNEYEII